MLRGTWWPQSGMGCCSAKLLDDSAAVQSCNCMNFRRADWQVARRQAPVRAGLGPTGYADSAPRGSLAKTPLRVELPGMWTRVLSRRGKFFLWCCKACHCSAVSRVKQITPRGYSLKALSRSVLFTENFLVRCNTPCRWAGGLDHVDQGKPKVRDIQVQPMLIGVAGLNTLTNEV